MPSGRWGTAFFDERRSIAKMLQVKNLTPRNEGLTPSFQAVPSAALANDLAWSMESLIRPVCAHCGRQAHSGSSHLCAPLVSAVDGDRYKPTAENAGGAPRKR